MYLLGSWRCIKVDMIVRVKRHALIHCWQLAMASAWGATLL